MDKQSLILHLEDDIIDCELIKNALSNGMQNFNLITVDNKNDFINAIETEHIDIILSDYKLPLFDGISALNTSKELCPDIPFIFVTGALGEKRAVETLRCGATDYILKDDLTRLSYAVNRALEERNSITKKKDAEKALLASEKRYQDLFDNAPVGYFTITDNNIIRALNFTGARLLGVEQDTTIGGSFYNFVVKESHDLFKIHCDLVIETKTLQSCELKLKKSDNTQFYACLESVPVITNNETPVSFRIAITNISVRKQAEEKLAETNRELIDSAHRAGMIDIATGTLHNVGNILNIVLTSTHMMNEIMATSKILSFFKANEILKEHIDDLENFMAENPKGKKLMAYYLALEKPINEEQSSFKEHLSRLKIKVDAIIEIIAAQQSYAGGISLADKYHLKDIIEDAFTIQSDIINQNHIRIDRQFIDLPTLTVQRTKLIHILINLIKNAKDAMSSISADKRVLRFILEHNEDAVFLKVSDSGVGISHTRIQKIFSHGYTTKSGGNGFGLNSCLNYMAEMGGRMWAESEGEGKGSTFILRFVPDKQNEFL